MGDQCKMAGLLNAWLRVPRGYLEPVINFEGDFVRSPFYHNDDRFADSSTHWSSMSSWPSRPICDALGASTAPKDSAQSLRVQTTLWAGQSRCDKDRWQDCQSARRLPSSGHEMQMPTNTPALAREEYQIMAIRSLRGHHPRIDPTAFVADGAQVIGDVVLGPGASVWFNAVIRGDSDRITVGSETNVQDGAILHADPGFPCTVGARVVIGHGAILHGCQISNDCLIGMGAIILNGATIGSGCIVGAGALVPEGKEFPARSLIIGVPSKVVRQVTDAEMANIQAGAAHYRDRALVYQTDLADE